MEQFIERLNRFNAKLTNDETIWRGAKYFYHVICENGHDMYVTPDRMQRGRSPCELCAHRKYNQIMLNESEIRYIEFLIKHGGKQNWEKWLGTQLPHQIICSNGHVISPNPTSCISNGRIVCRYCAGQDTYIAEAKFIDILIKRNAVPMWIVWYGTHKKHTIECEFGHKTDVIPTNVIRGQGICRYCAHMFWNIFYIVHNPSSNIIKFGITSTNERSRLITHTSNGFTELLYLIRNIDAKSLEDEIKILLDDNNYHPIIGYEYFNDNVLPLILNRISIYPNEK